MSKRTGLIGLAMAWLLLGAALLLVSAPGATLRAETQVAKVVVDPTSLTLNEPSGSGISTFTLTSEPAATVTVDLTASNSECAVSPAAADLDATNWSTGVTATITVIDDHIVDGRQTCWVQTGLSRSDDPDYDGLNVRDIKITVLDDDVVGILVVPTTLTVSEPSGSDDFTLALTSQPSETVSIPFLASNGECTVSPITVTLDIVNWSTGVTATVTAVDDTIPDGTQTCLIQTQPAVSADLNYSGIDPDDVSVAVHDDERPGILVVPTSLTIGEPSGFDFFMLSLSHEPTATVSVPLTASNSQCTVSSASLDLDATNWTAGVTATVTAVDDLIADGTQTCVVQTGFAISADPNYGGHDPEDVTVTVSDDDEPGIVVVPASLTISEPSGSAIFSLALTSQPMATVSISLLASNSECTVSPITVTLDIVNWSTGVTATVTAVDDTIPDGTQTCLIQTPPATSADPTYHSRDAGDVTVIVLDDDAENRIYLPLLMRNWPPLPGIPTLQPISNPDGNGTYAIDWSTAPHAQVFVLEESKVSSFSDAREIYVGSSTNHVVTGQGAARYYYRVKARNNWGDGGWSTVQRVDVLWEAEPNDEPQTQANGPVVSGLTYYGTFLGPADLKDYFYFDQPATHRVQLWLTNIAAGQDYDLVLRDANLASVGYEPKPGNANEYIDVSGLPAGRYYIQIYHRSSGGSAMEYHLRVVYE